MQGRLNEKGLTLVEMLVAFVVLLVTSLALMQTALVSISANMKNVLRDEAASIAELRLNDLRSQPFMANPAADLVQSDVPGDTAFTGANCPQLLQPVLQAIFVSEGFAAATAHTKALTASQNGVLVQRNIRSAVNFGFCTSSNVDNLDGNTKRLSIAVGWQWKGVNYGHSAMSILRRQ